jgi:AAA domain
MSEVAKKYTPQTAIESFLDTMYGEEKGFVYTPTKASSGYWQPYFFKWPEQRMDIVTHLLKQSKDQDCYVSPSIFKAPSGRKQAWKGSRHVWVEFDGNAPKNTPSGIPSPHIRIQSSDTGHEHWYWRLTNFETDFRALEGLARSLTYTLDADKSGWDCSQVLRPPGTLHQESGRRVKYLSQSDGDVTYSSFRELVKPAESSISQTNLASIPEVRIVVSKYRWPDEAVDLFGKPSQPIGSRSSAMTALGFFCVEMGMTNEECFSILINADERWGKYKNRSPQDRAKRLVGIISHCRGKKELESELSLFEREAFVSLDDFLESNVKFNWIYRDFMAERGLGILSAAPSIGKSTLSIRMGLNIALGKDFLIWKNEWGQDKKICFVSLEMGGFEIRKFFHDLLPSLNERERKIVGKSFHLFPLGYSLPLHNKDAQQMITEEIDRHEIDYLIIDSLKAATTLDERKLDLFFDWINRRIRSELGTSVWLVHHNRKPPNEGSRKPRGLEDLYGDTFISAHPSTVISLWRTSKTVLEVLPFKIRLAEEADSFSIKREKHLDFSLVGKDKRDESEASEPNHFE